VATAASGAAAAAVVATAVSLSSGSVFIGAFYKNLLVLDVSTVGVLLTVLAAVPPVLAMVVVLRSELVVVVGALLILVLVVVSIIESWLEARTVAGTMTIESQRLCCSGRRGGRSGRHVRRPFWYQVS
jgi:hypothetical protein